MNKQKKVNIKLWEKVAYISGFFSLVICFLLIVNYVQYKRIEPANTKIIDILVERLNKNPEDIELRKQIQELDLLARKAYFTNQWQVRTGAYILAIGVLILVISIQILNSSKKKEPEILLFDKNDYLNSHKSARKWVSMGGAFIVLLAMFFAFLTHNELGVKFAMAANPNSDSIFNAQNNNSENDKSNTNVLENDSSKTNTENASVNDTIIQSDTTSQEQKLSEFPSYKEIMANFPTFRGPWGNGITYKKNIPVSWNASSGKNIVWKRTIPLKGYNSPVIWGDKLFLSGASSTKRQVYCIDRNTGKTLWTADANKITGSPANSPKVTDDTGYAAPTVATDGRAVYAIFANGDVLAIDMEGKRIWARNLGTPVNHYGHSSSLMLFQNMLIVQYDHKTASKLMSLSTKTGKTLWSTPRKVKISWASPIVVYTGKQTEIMVSSDPFVASYNPFSGKELWKLDCMTGEVGPSLAYADGVVFAVNEYASLVAIQIGEKPKILWQNDEYLSDVPSPIATKKYLLIVTSYGVVVCYDSKTGEKYWEQEFANGFYSTPILVGNTVYLIDKMGGTFIFKLSDKYKQISNPQLGENVVSTPAFADGRIYIRADKNLYCIGSK